LQEKYETLDIEPAGRVGMLVALADAYAKTGANDLARQAIERAVGIVQKNVADAGDPILVPPYLNNVPEHGRMFKLADARNVDCDDLNALRG
jgi:hypothetical protein